MDGIAGKACIVTGSTKGIGLSVATALAEAGADVVVSSRSADDVDRVVAALDARSPGRVIGIACDVSRVEDCQELIGGAVEELGRLDVLINNAGVAWGAPLEEFPEAGWDKVMDTNVKGPFFLTQQLLPFLEKAATFFTVGDVITCDGGAVVS